MLVLRKSRLRALGGSSAAFYANATLGEVAAQANPLWATGVCFVMSQTVPLDIVAQTEVGLDRDIFFRRMLRELSGTIEAIVGVEEASGYVSAVGAAIGDWINEAYHAQMGPEDFDLSTVAAV